MHEILVQLAPGATVLDFCCGEGSFDARSYPLRVIRLDAAIRRSTPDDLSVEAEAQRLPFRSHTFDAVIANHALEHLHPLKPALQELGRVLKKNGTAYVSVPDARRFSDRLYRKLFRNRGGHVNLFGSSRELARMLSWYLGLPHAGTRLLYTSFAYLNRHNFKDRRAKRDQLRVPPLPESAVLALNAAAAMADSWIGTSLSVYGWALYFGSTPGAVVGRPQVNVCVRCGSALPDPPAKSWVLSCPYCAGRAVNRGRWLPRGGFEVNQP